jgi:hypothetical protein
MDGSPFDVMRGDVLACAPGLAPVLHKECREFLAGLGWKPPFPSAPGPGERCFTGSNWDHSSMSRSSTGTRMGCR